MSVNPTLLLDTCAIIFISQGRDLLPEATTSVAAASREGRLVVSPMSAWEIGLAISLNRLKTPLSAHGYFNGFLASGGVTLCGLEPDVLIDSVALPGSFHKDPVDRILVATARSNNFIVVTSDRAILAYGASGHVRCLSC